MRKGHITLEEREIIEISLFQGLSQKEVAQKLGRDAPVISREIVRNSVWIDWFESPRGKKKVYIAAKAQKKYQTRICKKGVNYLFKSPELMRYIIPRLKLGHSPQTISGRLHIEYLKDISMRISPAKIYQDCFSVHGRKQGWNKLLLRGKNRRRGRIYKRAGVGLIPNRVDIDARPTQANERTEFGHWEADTAWSKQNTSGLLVIVERVTRMTLTSCIPTRTMKDVSQATIKLLGTVKKVCTFHYI